MNRAPGLMKEAGAGDDLDRAAAGDVAVQVEVAATAVRCALGHGANADGGQGLHLGDDTVDHRIVVEVQDLGSTEHLTPVQNQVLVDERAPKRLWWDVAGQGTD